MCYSEPMIKTSESNKSLCALCRCAPGDTYTRNDYARHVGARYAQTRRNRTRVDQYMADACGFPGLAGMLVCPVCYEAIAYIVNNRYQRECIAQCEAHREYLSRYSVPR